MAQKRKDKPNHPVKVEQESIIQNEYASLLDQVKNDIQQSQLKAATVISHELNMLYWRIGDALSKKSALEKWGSKVIDHLAKDLSVSFPGMSGFSKRNLEFMKQFAERYHNGISETAVSEIPWGHNIILLQKLDTYEEKVWYAQKAIENGWSRSMLLIWIENDLYKREGKAITNFKHTLPPLQSDLAEQTLKDPYNLSFLTLDKKYRERELERGLMDHLQKFLMELGQGFAFVGRQYPIKAGKKDLSIDLLFYHLKLRCYVVVELLCCRQHKSSYVA